MVASEGAGRPSFLLPVIRLRFALARRLSLTNSVVLQFEAYKSNLRTSHAMRV